MGKSYRQLSLDERCSIACLQSAGHSIRQIAASLDRAPSTISREVRRNQTPAARYRPAYADERAWARRWRGSRLARQPDLQRIVLNRLAMGWSPEQVAGRLALENGSTLVSHETIYRFIDSQIRRTKDYAWRHYLPRGKTRRGRPRHAHSPIHHIHKRVPLKMRPACVESRRQPGHWEADLLHPRKAGAAILVAQERTSRYTLMAKQPGKHAQPVADQLKKWFAAMPAQLRRTLAQDNGPEFFLHHQLHTLGVKTFFCDPHSPWQKGGVENMNGRIRRYIPKGAQPDSFSNHDLKALASQLNNTPRKCLAFKTPAEVFSSQMLRFKCESTSSLSRG
jgi:transposase, IS30 family